jgi:SNF2 family DNA or RNA helicase
MKLRPYQLEAIDFLKAHPAAGLFIDMGLGKTAAVLHALLDSRASLPVLLVGPIRVIENVWEAEANKWQRTKDLCFSLVRGQPDARRRALATEADIYLTNPELLEEALLARSYGTLVIDESSMFKNPSTKRFKLIRKHLGKFKRRIILTGTPTPNSLEELWSQVFILDRGERLETAFYRFKNRYFRQVDYLGYKFEPVEGAEARITDLVSDIIFRVEAKGNLAPREAIDNPVHITLPPVARKLYDKMAKEAFIELSQANVSAASAAAVLMKLRQVASGFVYDDEHSTVFVHDEKIKATHEILDATGSPVIVVYNFQHELAALKKAFPQGVTLDKWNQKQWDAGKIPLLFLHPASGGHGLNLQYGSHTMVIFSASFSCEQMSQTKARIDRQGQEFPVVFHFLQSDDTVDELILAVLEAKAKTQATVLSLIKEYANAKANRR